MNHHSKRIRGLIKRNIKKLREGKNVTGIPPSLFSRYVVEPGGAKPSTAPSCTHSTSISIENSTETKFERELSKLYFETTCECQ